MEWSQASSSLLVAAAAPRRRPDPVLRARSPAGLRLIHLASRERLALWVAVQVLAATGMFAIVLANISLRGEIALPWPGLAPDTALMAGIVFWLVFGLLGGVRAHARPGGGVMTFSMPFIVAGTILGGPLAGGLMALVSELEARELRTQPWYGILANHSVSIIAAIAAAWAADLARSVFTPALPAQQPLVFFVVAMVTAAVFAVVSFVLVVPTLAIRGELSLAEASRSADATFRATSVGEGILAWLMAATYPLIGWWAPIACVVLILITWQAHDRSEALRHDDKTGLFNDAGFNPRLSAAVETARKGHRSAAFVLLDLDRFKAVNDIWFYEAGDEVLRATALRMLAGVRATDCVARMNRAGDEFAVLLDDIRDVAMAQRLAERLQSRIREPIRLRSRDGVVDVDASIGVVFLECGTSLTAADVVRIADARMQRGKSLGSGIVVDGDDDEAAFAERLARVPSRV